MDHASEETTTAPMVTDNDNNEHSPEETQEVPQETQPSEEADEGPQSQGTKNLWGYLLPCNPLSKLERIEFQKGDILIKIGRDERVNDWILRGFKISNQHCIIKYDGSKKDNECVLLIDNSTNGTYVNGHKIGKGNHRILREGNEIAFGTLSCPKAEEDYRFIFRHLAKTGPEEALYQYYDLAHELGKGSFANVVKAVHKATGKWFAVKMIQESRRTGREPTDTANAGPRKEIKREIEIMKSLEHPNVCKLQDVFYMKNNDISLVLELVEGGDLLDYILTRHGVSEEVTQHITYQLCDALAYVHSKGIAHRDLKPENVLLTNDNPPNVKVADFGLAKTADSLTMLKTMCGTPAYLAPEVVRQQNNEGYDNLVDSWSVGVIVFSMLTNCNPFLEDENQRDIRTRISERKVDWSTLGNSDISPECEDFIRRLLEDDPKTRMKLSESLKHLWLMSYAATHPTATPASSQAVDDLNATNLVSHDLENLQLNQDHGPGPSQSSQHKGRQLRLTNGNRNEDANENGNDSQSSTSIPGLAKTPPRETSSPRRPLGKEASRMLQRRAQVLDEAHENGEHIPEPSPEMIMEAARERLQRKQREGEGDGDEMNNGEAGMSNGNGSRNGGGPDAKGKGKRLRSELSSLSAMDVTEGGSIAGVGAGDEASHVKEENGRDKDVVMGETPAKKGRITRGSSSDEPTPTTKRGRGGATGGRGRGKGKAKLSEVSEENGPPPRRSGRNAGK